MPRLMLKVSRLTPTTRFLRLAPNDQRTAGRCCCPYCKETGREPKWDTLSIGPDHKGHMGAHRVHYPELEQENLVEVEATESELRAIADALREEGDGYDWLAWMARYRAEK